MNTGYMASSTGRIRTCYLEAVNLTAHSGTMLAVLCWELLGVDLLPNFPRDTPSKWPLPLPDVFLSVESPGFEPGKVFSFGL